MGLISSLLGLIHDTLYWFLGIIMTLTSFQIFEHRFHAMEIHDQPFFPSALRDCLTDALSFMWWITGASHDIARLLKQAIERAPPQMSSPPSPVSMSDSTSNLATPSDLIIDLCSGAGGPTPYVIQELNEKMDRPVKAVLTDLFPNLPAWKRAKRQDPFVDYHAAPVDATQVPDGLKGFRTLFLSFHHFDPTLASAILKDAIEKKQPIGIFEIISRSPKGVIIDSMVAGLSAYVFGLFIPPFSLTRLFFTYIIPIIPLVIWIDGIVSALRIYSPRELHELLASLKSRYPDLKVDEFSWDIKSVRAGKLGIVNLVYLIGIPPKEVTNK